jgi:antitoxin ParD1/3/4
VGNGPFAVAHPSAGTTVDPFNAGHGASRALAAPQRRHFGHSRPNSGIGKLCHNPYSLRDHGEQDMPTRNISLTPEQDAFVDSVVEAGEYQNASEAMRDALRALQQRRREDALKLKALRLQVKAGVEALERGDFVEVDAEDLEGYLDGLAVTSSAPPR